MTRARIGAFALAVATTGTLAVTVALGPAQATTTSSAAQVVATPVTSTNGAATLIVDPTSDLADTGASINVGGRGFGDDPGGMYIAVCRDAGATPNLDMCVGGPVPGNPTPGAWAHVVKSGTGVNVSNWNAGAFNVTLALPSVAGGSVDCVSSKCALYTVSDDGTKPGLNNRVALTFKAPASSVPSTPSSAIVQQVGSPTVAPGATQTVIFSGFKGGEQVNLTLFSAPVTLSPVTADSTGVARVDFVVPADFVDGAHRLEAIGAESGTVGVASFQVVIPTPTPSPTPTSTPTPSPTPSPTSSSVTSSAETSSSVAPTTAVTTSAADGGDSGGTNWWIWLILVVVVLAGLITWFVVYRRNKEAARAEQEKQLADAAAWEQTAYDPMADAPTMVLPPTGPPPGGPPPGADPYGLLSGRTHPYGVDPNAPTEFDQPGPNQQIPPGPTQYIGDPMQVIPPGQGGPGGVPGPYGPPTGRMPTPGSGPGQAGPGRVGPPSWEVPPEFADSPGPAQGPTGQGPTDQDQTGQDQTDEDRTDQDRTDQGPRTAQFRPDFDDPDDPAGRRP